jgi:hypothetical protein
VISEAAQMGLLDLLGDMVESGYETAERAYFSAVDPLQYKELQYKEWVDYVKEKYLDLAMQRCHQLMDGLALEKAYDPTGLGRDNYVLFAETLRARVNSKALVLELEMWQRMVRAQILGLPGARGWGTWRLSVSIPISQDRKMSKGHRARQGRATRCLNRYLFTQTKRCRNSLVSIMLHI